MIKVPAYVKKRSWSTFKDTAIHIIVGIMIGWWFAHGYVIDNGGVWPHFSSFVWCKENITELGGLAIVLSVAKFLYTILKPRNGN